ncbi:hypothetical protein B7Z00_01535 [Candidatus Saccharibacteria bacterium 32-50-10]|nr:MAG: hypothetical protein B7Z00_01535 [Candidatus Saccharibacteria bacterium 32-50-10]
MRSTATPTVRSTAPSPSNPASEPELKFETSDASGAIETLDTTAPLETPFISDAKVEKRPLGAFSQTGESSPKVDLAAALADENDDSDSSVANFGFTEMSTSEKSPEPSVGNQEVSDLEISEEALIGSTETADTTPSSETPVADEVASVESNDQQPIADTTVAPVEITTPAESTVAEAQSEDVEKSTPPLMPIANASIPQQYREKSEDHQAGGTIYDTENYHQPISPAPKKTHKKILSLILWLVGLVVLGVGLGTLFYYVILPALS